MFEYEQWRPLSWHCSNCGKIVTGYQNSVGDIKVECNMCGMVMVRKIKSRRHDTIDLYAPSGDAGHELYRRKKT